MLNRLHSNEPPCVYYDSNTTSEELFIKPRWLLPHSHVKRTSNLGLINCKTFSLMSSTNIAMTPTYFSSSHLALFDLYVQCVFVFCPRSTTPTNDRCRQSLLQMNSFSQITINSNCSFTLYERRT